MYPSLAGLRASELQRKNAPTSVGEEIRYNCHGWAMQRIQYADGRGPGTPYYEPTDEWRPWFDWAKRVRAQLRVQIRQLLAQRSFDKAIKLKEILDDNSAPWSKCLQSFDEENIPLFDRQDTDPELQNEILKSSEQMRKRKKFEEGLETYSKRLKTSFDIDLPQAPSLDRLEFGESVPEIPRYGMGEDDELRFAAGGAMSRFDAGPQQGAMSRFDAGSQQGAMSRIRPSRYEATSDDEGPRPSRYEATSDDEGPRPSRWYTADDEYVSVDNRNGIRGNPSGEPGGAYYRSL